MRLHGLIVVRASLSQAGLRLPANAMAPGVRYTFELRMAAAGHPQEAAAIGPAPLVLSMLFGGFFISASRIPPALRWIR